MRPFRRLLSLLLIVGIVWFIYNDEYEEAGVKGVWGGFKEDVLVIKEHPIVVNTIDSVRYHFKNLYTYISGEISDVENPPNVDKPDLNQPDAQSFSIYNIEINDVKSDIINQFGEPNRSSINEYGVQWNTYHESYQNFVMIAYNNDDKVAGLFTNQDLFTSTEDITLSSTKEEVRSQLGEPLESIRKGLVLYRYNEDEGQDTFLLDNNYITFFYDTHQNNVIAAIQIIKKDLEEQKQDYFANPSQELKEGLEYQLFDITNAARSKFELSVLDWHEPSRKVGRDHSEDMATNNFFSHTNLENESPFDRLADGDISFQMAGENLASGQPSSIFAHQGLMNSEGHRKNILKSDFRLMSVGIAFKENGHPFYTESFLTK